MEVIKYPDTKIENDHLYECTCAKPTSVFDHKGCGTVFRFRESEMDVSYDRNEVVRRVICPVCGSWILDSGRTRFYRL